MPDHSGPVRWDNPAAFPTLTKHGMENTLHTLGGLLHPNARVLDVGCGPGTISLDVAARVPEGSVVALDREPAMIRAARDLAAQSGVANGALLVADAYRLPFSDSTFDLTYSNAVLEWLCDPLAALAEQRRVTRDGGFVLTRLSDLASQVINPGCPAVERVLQTFRSLKELDGVRHSPDPTHNFAWCWNPFLGAAAATLFTKAGFIDVRLSPCPDRKQSGEAELLPRAVLPMWPSSVSGIAPWAARLRSLGMVDQETLDVAAAEIASWLLHPCASVARFNVIVSGTVRRQP